VEATMQTISVTTDKRTVFVDVTALLSQALATSGMRDGALVAYVPHTTAGMTINENADPSVRRDILMVLDHLVPGSLPYTHGEGNGDAHVKAALVGSSVTIPVHQGRLQLGTWQGVYFAEFDGPRRRHLLVQFLPSAGA
jgi:secondary thiamine-phosphate synthase enzyme